jgi:hypothetical protein
MSIFKVVFANNEPISCKEIPDGLVLDGNHQYVHTNGKLIYAIIKADSESDVMEKVAEMIVEVRENYSPPRKKG